MSAGDTADGRGGPAGRPRILDRLRALFGFGGPSLRNELEDALSEPAVREEFSQQERTMLKNVLDLHEYKIADIMVPRADIVAVPLTATLGDVLGLFRTAGHSRLPVFDETLDNPKGMVHIRDFLDFIAGMAQTRTIPPAPGTGEPGKPGRRRTVGALDLSLPLSDARRILREVLYVPPTMPAIDLLMKMQASRTHMALVIDEYGGTDGLVSIEDIVETIVGDIEDEHDDETDPRIEREADGAFVVEGRAALEDVSKAMGLDFSAFDDAEEVETLGGLVATLAGYVPEKGEIVQGPQGASFEVLDADPNRVKDVRIRFARPVPRDGAGEPARALKAEGEGKA